MKRPTCSECGTPLCAFCGSAPTFSPGLVLQAKWKVASNGVLYCGHCAEVGRRYRQVATNGAGSGSFRCSCKKRSAS